MKRAFTLLLLIGAAFSLLTTGCVSGRTYRANIPSEQVPPLPKCFPGPAAQLPPRPPCSVNTAADFKGACISYIEFDDLGELRLRDGSGAATQVDAAVQLIAAAMQPGSDQEKTQPIVMVLVHGWKHNAAAGPPEDANVQGVKDFADMLRDHYPDSHVNDHGDSCDEGTPGCKLLRHPVVAVYIGWRGNSVSHYFPVVRQFSYFGREKTAYRVGNTSLTDTLMEISRAARPPASNADPFQPFLLMVGHSFGGLVLERTLAQAFMERLERAGDANSAFADLVVYVNTAVAATDSKQVIDLLAEDKVQHHSENAANHQRYPLFVSISSSDDQATTSGIFIGHGLPALGLKLSGSSRSNVPLVCYEPENGIVRTITNFSQADFYLHTAPHFEAMQSHELKQLSKADCDDPGVAQKYLDRHPLDSFGPTPMIGSSCYVIVPKNTLDPKMQNLPRCNGTPYFVMEVPHDIIPDHGTIFTERLFKFLTVFLQPASGTLNKPSSEPQRGVILKRQTEKR